MNPESLPTSRQFDDEASQIRHLEELLEKFWGRLDDWSGHIEKFDERFEKMLNIVEVMADAQVESRKQFDEFRAQTEAKLRELDEARQQDEQRIQSMIEIMDDLIRRKQK
jgi:hypothetical protein